MKHTITLIFSTVLFFALGCSMQTPGSEARANRSALQSTLKTLYPTVSGQQISLGSFSGKIVLLHFMASWCRECSTEAASLNNVHASFKDSNFSVVGVAVDDDPFQMQVFNSRHSISFPVILDTSGDLKAFFGAKVIPTTIFLGKNGLPIRFSDPTSGEISAKLEGARVWDSSKPVEMIASLVESKN